MSRTALIKLLLLVLLPATSCDKTTSLTHKEPAGGVYSIAHLKSLCRSSSVTITDDITIRGAVTANDLFGEFYKMIVIEDESGGISIAVDLASTVDAFYFGAIVTVYCNGLTLCDYGGKIQLGTQPTEYGAGRIPAAEIPRHLDRSDPEGPLIEARTLAFNKIDSKHIDTYVCFEGVYFIEANPWCDLDPETGRPMATERLLADGAGRTFAVRTASTCTYAKETVPQGTVSIKGVIDYFGGRYYLRVMSRDFTLTTAARRPRAYPSAAGY